MIILLLIVLLTVPSVSSAASATPEVIPSTPDVTAGIPSNPEAAPATPEIITPATPDTTAPSAPESTSAEPDSSEPPSPVPPPDPPLITEVNFRNKTADYIILKTTGAINFAGYTIEDDKVFFTFPDPFFVSANTKIRITFHAESEQLNTHTIELTKSGLTATTEQVVLRTPSNEIADMVCWENATPAKTEVAAMSDFHDAGAWSGPCLNSEEVDYDKSIIRSSSHDTDTARDWEIEKDEIPDPIPEPETDPETDPETPEEEQPEKITTESEIEEKPPVPIDYSQISLTISEFLPNPEGSDTGNEWIELFNPGPALSLNGWQLDDMEGGSKPFIISDITIASNAYHLFLNNETKINLNNGTDSVRLIGPDDVVFQEIPYESAPDNESYALIDSTWAWTEEPTPGTSNVWVTTPEPSGNSKSAPVTYSNGDLSTDIIISEIYPKPESDEDEWIELYNNGIKPVNLGNWTLDDSEKGSKPYTLSDSLKIEPDSFLVITKEESKLNLNNTGDSVRLFNFNGKLINEIEYTSGEKGQSYARITTKDLRSSSYPASDDTSSDWAWTAPSPNSPNTIFYLINGEVAAFNGDEQLILITQNEIGFSLTYNPSKHTTELLETVFLAGARVELTYLETAEGNELISYTVLEQPPRTQEEEDAALWSFFSFGGLSLGSAFMYREKLKLLTRALLAGLSE